MTGTVSVRYVHRIIEAASQRGFVREQLCAAAGLTLAEVQGPEELRVPDESNLRLWQEAMSPARDVAFSLAVAATVRPNTHEVMGFACMTAPNLGEALQRAVRFIRIFATAAWQLECADGLAHMTF